MELIAALEDATAARLPRTGAFRCGRRILLGPRSRRIQGCSRDKTATKHRADAERIARLFLTLYELPIPTIAAVHGPAIAGGTGLAIICDFTLATPAAKFGFTEVRIGFVPALVSAFSPCKSATSAARICCSPAASSMRKRLTASDW